MSARKRQNRACVCRKPSRSSSDEYLTKSVFARRLRLAASFAVPAVRLVVLSPRHDIFKGSLAAHSGTRGARKGTKRCLRYRNAAHADRSAADAEPAPGPGAGDAQPRFGAARDRAGAGKAAQAANAAI